MHADSFPVLHVEHAKFQSFPMPLSFSILIRTKKVESQIVKIMQIPPFSKRLVCRVITFWNNCVLEQLREFNYAFAYCLSHRKEWQTCNKLIRNYGVNSYCLMCIISLPNYLITNIYDNKHAENVKVQGAIKTLNLIHRNSFGYSKI